MSGDRADWTRDLQSSQWKCKQQTDCPCLAWWVVLCGSKYLLIISSGMWYGVGQNCPLSGQMAATSGG